jgi:putative membrane protein
VPGFAVSGFFSALIASVIVSFVSSILHNMFEE